MMPGDDEKLHDLARDYGGWADEWIERIADAVGIEWGDDGPIRVTFEPGVLPALHADVSGLSEDELRYMLTSALVRGSVLLMKLRASEQ